MRTTVSRNFALAAISAIALGVPNVTVSGQTPAERPQFPPPKPEVQPPAVEANLKTFDVLDFDVFSNQKWDRLQESHAQDIIVTWPNGHETRGIAKHIEDLKALFVYAPDITIKVHPIRFGSGSWTAVTGVMTGTLTRSMPSPDGKTIRADGQAFRDRHGDESETLLTILLGGIWPCSTGISVIRR